MSERHLHAVVRLPLQRPPHCGRRGRALHQVRSPSRVVDANRAHDQGAVRRDTPRTRGAGRMSERHLHAVVRLPRTPAERLQVLIEFVERYGLDYWDHHDTAPDPGESFPRVEADPQLDFWSGAA